MIDKATVKQILDAADIVDVVSDYVHLTKRGANYMGLCPFHNERTPSFSVSPAKGICHCFSCGKGGSPVNFIMEKEGISFHDALLHLATKYGITVEERELTDEERALQSQREGLFVANEWAMKRFIENMNATEEGRNVGLEYFYQRGITPEAIKKFKLGYALDKPTDMYDAAKRQGFDMETLQIAGLCGLGQSGKPYDRFRGRVIFPIFNPAGKPIAFGGRGIKGEAAKYINSPESPIYVKSNELYGIYQAKNAIIRHKKCFLVEGYMDVIGMWQSGMENVVASSGTSLTDGQIALLHRFTENVTLIYDGDAAGIKASLRGIDLLLSHKLDIKILLLPDGDDPDSFARKHTPEQFRKYVEENEVDFITFKTRVLLGEAKSDPSARAEAINSIVESLACISQLIKRTLYIQQCAEMMGISEQLLTIEVGKARERVATRLYKQRHNEQLQHRVQNPFPQTQSLVQDVHNPVQTSDAPLAAEVEIQSVDPLIVRVEKNVIEYVIKYGMTEFCELNDEENNIIGYLNVAEYVKEELEYDDMHFTNPLYQRTFLRILSLIDAYKQEEAQEHIKAEARRKVEHESWVNDLLTKSASMQEIETAEKDFAEKQLIQTRQEIKTFAIDYIGHTLGSDPDDEIRRLVLSIITPRYTLSKYHSKNVTLELEEDKLSSLIPRALIEWKDAILARRYKEAQAKLKQAADAGDSEEMLKQMSSLKHISTLRCEVAKSIGERILTPRR